MERERFTPPNHESSDDSSEEKKDDKKTKKVKSASDLAKLLTRDGAAKPSIEKPEADKEKAARQTGEKSEAVDDSVESDENAPLEELSPEEQAEAIQAVVAEHLQEIQTSTEEIETAEDQAAAAYLQTLQQRLEGASDNEAAEGVIDEVYEEAAAGFTGETEELPVEPAAEELPPRPQMPAELPADQPIRLASTRHDGNLPPREPLNTGPAFASSESSQSGRSSRDTTAERSDDTIPRWEAMRHERYAQNRGLLVGGIVGYLIGRRRGRIKTEQRLQAVQTKLEKQVASLEQRISDKETAIRRLAREKTAELVSTATAVPVAAAEAVRPPSQQASFEQTVQPVAERTSGHAGERGTDETSSHEKLSVVGEAGVETAANPPKPEVAKVAVDNLNKVELLALSSQIRVGETNLRRVYEAQLVDERGLRRLIKEHQAGHDMRRALAREFLAKELKFERDPSLRDLQPAEAPPRRTSESKQPATAHDTGTASAGLLSDGSTPGQPKSAVTASNPVSSSRPKPPKHTRRQTEVSPSLLIGLAVTTIGLAIYALWLTITR